MAYSISWWIPAYYIPVTVLNYTQLCTLYKNTNLYTFWCVNENISMRSQENAINSIVFLGPVHKFLKINCTRKKENSHDLCVLSLCCVPGISRTTWVYISTAGWGIGSFYWLFQSQFVNLKSGNESFYSGYLWSWSVYMCVSRRKEISSQLKLCHVWDGFKIMKNSNLGSIYRV